MASYNRQVIGVDWNLQDKALNDGLPQHAVRSADRPMETSPSLGAAHVRNFSTGAIGEISCLAYVAPHEVAALFRAIRAGRTGEVHALRNRLAPLISLISGQDFVVRELLLRQIAHARWLLASPDARGLSDALDAAIVQKIERTLKVIALAPIKWV